MDESVGLVTTGVAPAVILHTPAGASGGLAAARDSSISSAMNSSTVRLNIEDWAYLCVSEDCRLPWYLRALCTCCMLRIDL